MSAELTTKADPGRFETALPISNVKESKTNPRRDFQPEALQELADSIRTKGLLQPIVVRPLNGGTSFELVCGARRLRAAKLAGLDALPASVRILSDQEVLEIQVIENLQRTDLHALEEARGYQQLLATKGYDVARIAERVGRSVKYVYDRVKLLGLTKEAQDLFLRGKFTPGHAILLARLKPEDQKRAIDIDDDAYGPARADGLFQHDRGLPFDDDGEEALEKEARSKDPYLRVKPVSVRELEAWIQDKVRFDSEHIDPVLFPETAATLQAARAGKQKVIYITREYRAGGDVRKAGKERVFGDGAWERADGKEDSKTCGSSRVGLVVCGQGQGEAFLVCVDKERCATHGAAWQKERKKRQAQGGGGGNVGSERDRQRREEEEHRKRRAQEEADRLRWKKAAPAILQALVAAVKKAPTKADGLLANLVIRGLDDYQARSKDVEKLVPRGKTAEDVLRHAAMIVVASQVSREGWRADEELVPLARGFNVDARKIRDEVAPPPAKERTCRFCGCTEEKACPPVPGGIVGGPCTWISASADVCSAAACVAKLQAEKKGKARKAKKGRK